MIFLSHVPFHSTWITWIHCFNLPPIIIINCSSTVKIRNVYTSVKNTSEIISFVAIDAFNVNKLRDLDLEDSSGIAYHVINPSAHFE